MKLSNKILLGVIILLAAVMRLAPLNFPAFTTDETRIAYRAYVLSHAGKDELGRTFPLIFNALEDYQLPLTSYVTAVGVLVSGKNDFGARLPFILIGIGVVFLIYKLGENFLEKKYAYLGALIAALSPGLIFFSRFPNEFIVGTFLILLLVLEILRKHLNKLKIIIIILLMILTSKFLWFTLVPVIAVTLFLNNNLKKREKIKMAAISLIPVLIALLVYFKVPQGIRSLVENNFYFLSDVTVKNSIERMRGEKVLWWPSVFDRALFNKADVLINGLFNWASQLSLSRLFGEFDSRGVFGLLKTGAFAKIVLIPFLSGLYLIVRGGRKDKLIFLYIIFLTFPLVFLYPKEKIELTIAALPFFALISAYGFRLFGTKLARVLIIILILESVLNLFFIKASIKNTNDSRPFFVRQIIKEASEKGPEYNIAFSDDITEDIVPFVQWQTKFNPADAYEQLEFPYRFKQTKISDIKIIGNEDTFYNCAYDKKTFIFASARDLKKIQHDIRVEPAKVYKDLLDREVVYLMPSKICVH